MYLKYTTIAFYLVAALFSPFKLLSRAFLNRNKIKPSVLISFQKNMILT